jgi:phosphopantetheine adenylyltransferase
MGQMKNFKQLIKELPSKTIVFAFGRFNPPTTGHELLIKAVKKLAQQKRADHVIYASRSQDAKKNPLTVERKVHYLNMMFPQTHFVGANDHVRTFIEAAKELNKKYKNIVMVAGSDRVSEFNRLLNTYNGKEFNFDTIEVISAGERDPDADNATGMSATKMRAAAQKGNYVEFKKGLPSTMRDIDGKRLMNDIRQGMGLDAIREEIKLVKDVLREQYFLGEIFNVGDIVESADEVFTIVKRGSNHLLVQGTNGLLVSKWISDVAITEREFMLDEELTQKTLKPIDKIKVARVIATMLGLENVESTSNPTNLINLALRRVRTKALNAEALSIIDKMLKLATQMDIQYDTSLVPTKLKEAAVIVKPKEVMSFKDFEKIKKQQNLDMSDEPVNDSDKDAELDPDYNKTDIETGGLLVQPYPSADDNLRRRKVKYQIGESEKRLPQSFRSRMNEVTEAADPAAAAAEKAAKETAKAQLSVKHAKEKEALHVKQAADREKLKEESDDSDYEKMIAILDFSDDSSEDEIDKIVAELSDDDIIDEVYDDEEVVEIDDETGEEIEQDEDDKKIDEQLNEVLSRMQRIKAKQRLRRTAAKRKRSTKIALRKFSSSKTINKRARRAAVKALKNRLLRGRNPNKLSVGEKERVERIIASKKTLVNRIALKMVPRVRKIEKARMSHTKVTKGSSPSVF